MTMAYPSEETGAKRDPRANVLMRRLASIRKMAEDIRASAGTTADKIVGSMPTNAGIEKNLKEVSQAGFFGEVTEQLSYIEITLQYAIENLRRFDCEF